MSGIEIVRQQEIGFDAHGQDVMIDQTFVKLSVSMRGLLHRFQGARLSAFLLLALNEAEICLGRGGPLSIYDIAEEMDCSPRNVLRAMQYLTRNNFATEMPERGPRDEKRYRVSGYAWFGDPRRVPPAASRPGPDKMSDPDPQVRGQSNDRPGVTKGAPVVVVVNSPTTSRQEQTTPTAVSARVRVTLSEAGIWGAELDRLAATVTEEVAERWALWIRWASEEAMDRYPSPAGLARFHLLQDPTRDPESICAFPDNFLRSAGPPQEELTEPDPQVESPEPVADDGGPVYPESDATGGLKARDVWHATLAELKLSMTKATFDTWVRPTAALGWDGDGLVVRAPSVYAIEWLEHRVQTAIQRTLAGIAGRPVQVRYEVRDG